MKNRKRNRMMGYDYSNDNLYFVTICVKNRKCCLCASVDAGRDPHVQAGASVDAGRDPHEQAGADRDLPVPILKLNEYGLIVEDRILWLSNQYEYVKIHNYVVMSDHVHIILEINSQMVGNKEIKIKSLSSLLGAFKTTSSKLIHLSGFSGFAWQRSFHDRIIRSHQEYLRISKYIDLNPEKWIAK